MQYRKARRTTVHEVGQTLLTKIIDIFKEKEQFNFARRTILHANIPEYGYIQLECKVDNEHHVLTIQPVLSSFTRSPTIMLRFNADSGRLLYDQQNETDDQWLIMELCIIIISLIPEWNIVKLGKRQPGGPNPFEGYF